MLFYGGNMPPKVRINKSDIIDAAVNIVRIAGAGALNARSIATALGCSTQPIFSNFQSMDELDVEVIKAAYRVYYELIASEVEKGKYPIYKAYGMAYIRFAREECELFKLLFMCDRRGEEFVPTSDFDASVEMIMQANGFDRSRAELVHLEVWSATHGVATMIATSFLELDEQIVSRILSDVYSGIKQRHIEEANDECN